jgi:hypothetical protein
LEGLVEEEVLRAVLLASPSDSTLEEEACLPLPLHLRAMKAYQIDHQTGQDLS